MIEYGDDRLFSGNERSRIILVPLKIHDHKKNIIVEDIRANEFYEMSPASVEAVKMIQTGKALGEIEDALLHKYPNEDIDIYEFIESLLELQLVAQFDDQIIIELNSADEEAHNLVQSTGWINHLGKLLFRTPFILVYLSAALFCGWIILTRPWYIPELHTMHMFGSMTLNVIIWTGLSLFLLALHEVSHFLAARSFGVPAKYGLGHRLYFLVLETDISNVWKLKPRQRLIPFLAGMMNDFLMLALTIAARIIYPEMSDLLYEIFELASLYLCIMLIFQTLVFMKTDLYFVIETVSGTLNLKERTDEWLKGLFHKNREKEVWFVKVYAVIYGGGLAFSGWLFITFAFPQFLHFLEHARDYLSYPVTNFYFWDGVLFLIANGLSLVLLFYSWIRKLIEYVRSKSESESSVAS